MPAISPINALPSFTSLEENKNILASTPSSFQDIPPVLRHREENVSIALDPALEGFSADAAAHGTLYVLTRSFSFIYKLIIKIYFSVVF